MRYMPTLRSPVSGSLVTTQGSVMKRPPSSGQHFWIGRLSSVGGGGGVEGRGSRVEGPRISGALGQTSHLSFRTSNFFTTCLHGPSLTTLGRACRRSKASESSL